MKRRIAIISEHASPIAELGGADGGGQNVYVAEIAAQLIKNNYQVDVFTRWENQELPQVMQLKSGYRVIHVKAGPLTVIPKEELLPFMADFAAEMARYIKANRVNYHLIHANFFMSGWVAMQLKKEFMLPFVMTFHALGKVRKIHQQEEDKFPIERISIEEDLVIQADRIIAECPQDESDLIRYYAADPAKITVIPCGYNPEEFFPMDKKIAKAKLNIDEDTRVILQLGRMVPRKGVDNVIAALSFMEDRKQLKLIIVGGEPDQIKHTACPELSRLQRLAKILNVENEVIFAGRKDRSQLKVYYNAADVFVTTPWYEPFGITPLEAMACGTPVIGANVGGIKYSVVDGETGFLVPPKSPKILAEKLNSFLADQELASSMGQESLKRVADLFSWEKVTAQLMDVYHQLPPVNVHTIKNDIKMIHQSFEEAAGVMKKTAILLSDQLATAGEYMSKALENGNKILVCGNGGSAAESQHFTAELVGRFELPFRKGLPVISLNSDTAVLTAWSNDFGFEEVFARQVQAYGQPGDVLLCMSTSGSSPNLIKAMQMANELGLTCINMLGKSGGDAVKHGLINLIVPSDNTQRIQEIHLQMVHLICTMIEDHLFCEIDNRYEAYQIPLQSSEHFKQVI